MVCYTDSEFLLSIISILCHTFGCSEKAATRSTASDILFESRTHSNLSNTENLGLETCQVETSGVFVSFPLFQSQHIYTSKSCLTVGEFVMDFAIATISTKGQLVIPASLRDDLKAGEQVLIVKDDERYVVKKMSDVAKDIQDDLLFAKRADEAYDRLLSSKQKGLTMKEFLAEASKW